MGKGPELVMQETDYEVQVVESGSAGDLVDPDSYEEMLKARIPLGNNPRKASYLSYRASGFSVRESCALAEVHHSTVKKWRRDDEEFRTWESGEKLAWLQSNVAHDLQQMEFMRNFRLCLRMDKKVLYKAALSLSLLTEREMEILKVIRKHYTPQDIIAVQKALVPEPDHLPPGVFRKSVTVTVEGREVDDQSARAAAARNLLERFTDNGKEEQKLIEGEVVEERDGLPCAGQ